MMNEAQLVRPDLMVSKKHFIPGPCFSCKAIELLVVVDFEVTSYEVNQSDGTVKTRDKPTFILCGTCYARVCKFISAEK